MKLVIAEKPSVGAAIAAVLGANKKRSGYFEGSGYLVSWCIGHLISLADAATYNEQYRKWKYDDLPIVPQDWQFTVASGKEQQFSVLKDLMHRSDVSEIVNACDSGREGELIFRFVYEQANCKKPFSRLWISSMEESAIREGFSNLKDGRSYDNLYQSALCRAKADWLVGINATRLFSILYHKTLNVGRVQTPTLTMLVNRDYKWTNETVSRMLEKIEYLGHTLNFKTRKQSYKSKKTLWNDPSEWVIFENTQPPIVEESVFLIVQNIRRSRRRPTKMGDMGIFSGLLYCAECGGKMYQCRATNFTEEQKYFICSTYRKGKDLCTTHSIKNVVLHEIVLRNLREAIEYVTQYEAEFIQEAADSRLRERDAEFSRKRETLSRAESRIAELDNLFKHLYEDNVTGKLSDERFIKMSRDYELEQENLKSMAEVLREEIKQQEKQKTNVKAFISVVKKYTDMQELDASILREFIDRIEVSHTDKKSKTREITIVYNFIGAFDFERAKEKAQNTTQKQQRTA